MDFQLVYLHLHFLAVRRTEEVFAPTQDGYFKCRERSILAPSRAKKCLLTDILGSILKWPKSGDQDICKEKQSLGARVVVAEAP